jgi:hypothetical protein
VGELNEAREVAVFWGFFRGVLRGFGVFLVAKWSPESIFALKK